MFMGSVIEDSFNIAWGFIERSGQLSNAETSTDFLIRFIGPRRLAAGISTQQLSLSFVQTRLGSLLVGTRPFGSSYQSRDLSVLRRPGAENVYA